MIRYSNNSKPERAMKLYNFSEYRERILKSPEEVNKLYNLRKLFKGRFFADDSDGNPVIWLKTRNGVNAGINFSDFQFGAGLRYHVIICDNYEKYGRKKLWKIQLSVLAACCVDNFELARKIYAIPDSKIDSDFVDKAAEDFNNDKCREIEELVTKMLQIKKGSNQ